jgi:hypothetical protein
MPCPSCASLNQAEFTTEMMIHFKGVVRIDNPGVLALPKIAVCMDCGAAQFTIMESQRRLLRKGIRESLSAAA